MALRENHPALADDIPSLVVTARASALPRDLREPVAHRLPRLRVFRGAGLRERRVEHETLALERIRGKSHAAPPLPCPVGAPPQRNPGGPRATDSADPEREIVAGLARVAHAHYNNR